MLATRLTPNSAAYSDALTLSAMLPSSLLPISRMEMHLLAYLSRIVALWQGLNTSTWGYNFIVNDDGFPFSADFEVACDALAMRGLIDVASDGRSAPIPDRLIEERSIFFENSRYKTRLEFIEPVVAAVLALPSGAVRSAVNRTAGIRSAIKVQQSSALLDESDVEELTDDFLQIREAFSDHNPDMLSATIVWLTALLRTPVEQ